MPSILLCYRRRSVVRSASDLVSPARQRDAVEGLARAHGYQTEWYEDLDIHNSARNGDRPGWQNLHAQFGRPDVVGIAAWDLSRIYRNVKAFLELVDELESYNLSLFTIKENFDTSHAIGRAVVTILMTIYQLESDFASERMSENIYYKQHTLKRHWGPAPFGTQRDPKTKNLIPDLETVPALRFLYEKFVTGAYTYDRVTSELNQAAFTFRDRNGNPRPWNRDDVRRCLAAWRLYRGDLPLGRQKDNPEEVLVGAHDPILDPALCDRVGDELKKRRHGGTYNKRRFYLLGGLAHCAECGHPLHGAYQSGVRRYRHTATRGECTQSWVDADTLEAELYERISWLVRSSSLVKIIESESDALRRLDASPEIAEIREQIKESNGRITRLTDLAVDGLIPKAEYIRRKTEIQNQLKELNSQLPHTNIDELEDAMHRALEMIADLQDMEPTEQHRILRNLLKSIEVRDSKIVKLIPRPWAALLFQKAQELEQTTV